MIKHLVDALNNSLRESNEDTLETLLAKNRLLMLLFSTLHNFVASVEHCPSDFNTIVSITDFCYNMCKQNLTFEL